MADQHDLLHFRRREDWRAWLQTNHRQSTEAWLVLSKAKYRHGDLSLSDAVEEALCFGWIDGKLRSLDSQRYVLRFTPRRPDSIWSVSNIIRAKRLIRQGLMTEAGLEKVAQGRRNKQWRAAYVRERTDAIPRDLAAALHRSKGATAGYRRLNDSRKKALLHWLSTAKTPGTRKKRIDAIVAESAER